MKHKLLTLITLLTISLNSRAIYLGHATKAVTGEFLVTNSAANSTGAVISDDSISLRNGFDMSFSVKFGLNNGHSAEGLVFMLLKKKSVTLGSGGGGIGYQGIDSSLAIEFDSYGNGTSFDDAGNGNTFDHIAVRVNGLFASTSRISNNVSVPNISDNALHTIRVVYAYDTKTLTVYLDGTQYISMVYDMSANVFGGKTGVYWGVSAATNTNAYAVTLSVNSAVTTLPVKLISFNAVSVENNVQLTWSTAAEYNADRFEVLRSFDGINWDVIGTVSCAGNSNSVKHYNFTDYTSNGRKAYYRLHQFDFDGKSEMFKVISAGKENNPALPTQFYDMSGNKVFFGTKAEFLNICESGKIFFAENGDKFSKQ